MKPVKIYPELIWQWRCPECDYVNEEYDSEGYDSEFYFKVVKCKECFTQFEPYREK